MPSRVEAVTTFTEQGYETHAEKFLDSWKLWGIPIHCYEEPLLQARVEPYIYEYDLDIESPQMEAFRGEGKYQKGMSYIWNAVKWSHRIFALAARARKSQAEFLINIDSDIVVFDTVPDGFVESLIGEADIAYMPRKTMYSECSFVVYRLNPLVRDFIAAHERFYTSGMIFELKFGWTDCHAFDAMVGPYREEGLVFKNINGGIPDSMHPFVNGPLGKYMDHMKGARKLEGKSRKNDFVVTREEPYWTGNPQ